MYNLENNGKKWSSEEENILLEELETDICIEEIAKKHKRTRGAIKSRISLIVYNLYLNNNSIEDINKITKLSNYDIEYIIKKENDKNNFLKLKNEIKEIKNILGEIKNETILKTLN